MKRVIHRLNACMCAAAMLCLTAGVSNAQPNLISDPGFESGTVVPGGVGGWDVFNGAAFSMDYARSGDWSINLTVVPSNNVPGAFEILPAVPGENFTLTGYYYTPTALLGPEPAFGGIQFTFFDSGGNDLGTVETPGAAAADFVGVGAGFPDAFPGFWIPLEVTATAPAGTVTVQPFPIYIDFSGNSQGIYVDDMELVSNGIIPEPTTFSLAGLGIAALWMIRRRR